MSDKKITELTDGGAVQATDEFVAARAGGNVKIAGSEIGGSITPPVTFTGTDPDVAVLTIQPASPATSEGNAALTIKADDGTDALILDADGSFHSISPFVGQEQPYIVDRQGLVIVNSYDNTNSGTSVLRLLHEEKALFVVRTSGHGAVAEVTAANAGDVPIQVAAAASQTANLQEWYDENFDLQAAVTAEGFLKLLNVPTSDPHIAGVVWNSSGVLHISAG